MILLWIGAGSLFVQVILILLWFVLQPERCGGGKGQWEWLCFGIGWSVLRGGCRELMSWYG